MIVLCMCYIVVCVQYDVQFRCQNRAVQSRSKRGLNKIHVLAARIAQLIPLEVLGKIAGSDIADCFDRKYVHSILLYAFMMF